MPIGSYPRITLNNTEQYNNPQSGTGLALLNPNSNQYVIADTNTFQVNNGGLASEETLIGVNGNVSIVGDRLVSDLGPTIANLLYDTNTDISAANTLGIIEENLRSINYGNESAGDLLAQILAAISNIESMLASGTGAIQIKGSNGNLAHVSSTNRLDVRL
jgi:hypothetical protein